MSAAKGRERPAGAVGTAVGGMIAMAAALGIGRFIYTPILPYMSEAVPLEPSDAGLIAAANFLGYMVGALLAATGWLRGRRRFWLLGALLASGATTAAMALTSAVSMFLLLRFAGGAASAFVMVFGSALVFGRLGNAGRPALAQVHFAGVGLGIALSAVAVTTSAALGYGWQAQWLVGGALSAAAFAAAFILLPPLSGERNEAAAAPSGIGQGALPLIVAYGLFGFGYVITATFISTMVRATPAIAATEPYVWLAVGLSAIPSVAFWTWVGRRCGNRTSFAMACVAEAAGVAISVLIAHPAATLAAAGLLGGTFMGITALGLVMGRDRAEGDPRRILGLLTAAFGLGQMIGPAFAGYVSEFTGSYKAPSLAAALLLLIAAVLAVALRTATPPPRPGR